MNEKLLQSFLNEEGSDEVIMSVSCSWVESQSVVRELQRVCTSMNLIVST